MAGQILFVQGGGEGAHGDWDDKLVASLRHDLGDCVDVRYPQLPNEGDPHFQAWKRTLVSEIETLDAGAILVGHSIGAAILAHTLAEAPPVKRPGGLFLLVMPFIGAGGWPSDEITAKPDLGARLPPGMAIFLYHGDANETVDPGHLDLNATAIPQAEIRRLPGRDHQFGGDLSAVAADIKALG